MKEGDFTLNSRKWPNTWHSTMDRGDCQKFIGHIHSQLGSGHVCTLSRFSCIWPFATPFLLSHRHHHLPKGWSALPSPPGTPTPPSWPFHIRCSVLSRCLFWIKWWEVLAACCHIYTRRPVDKKAVRFSFLSLTGKNLHILKNTTQSLQLLIISHLHFLPILQIKEQNSQLQSEYSWNTAAIK